VVAGTAASGSSTSATTLESARDRALALIACVEAEHEVLDEEEDRTSVPGIIRATCEAMGRGTVGLEDLCLHLHRTQTTWMAANFPHSSDFENALEELDMTHEIVLRDQTVYVV
jgi:hypothetical protein